MENKPFWREFIQMYQALPCLWKIDSQDYSNRIKKNKAYVRLVHKLKEIYPNATRELVVKKINVLRTNYRRESKKAKEILDNHGQEYVPVLWYYDLMTFLNDQQGYKKRKRVKMENKQPVDKDIKNRLHDPDESSRRNTLDSPLKDATVKPWNNQDNISPKLKERVYETETLLDRAVEQLTSNSKAKDCENIVQYWKAQYSVLESKQKTISRKIISDILFHGSLGELDISHATKIQEILLQRTETLYSTEGNNLRKSSTPHSSVDVKECTFDESTNIDQIVDLDSSSHSSEEAPSRRTDTTANPLDISNTLEMQANLKLMIKLNWSSEQIMDALREVYEDDAPSRKQVIQLVQQFEESDDEM